MELPLRAHVVVIQDNDGDGALLRQAWAADSELKLTTFKGGQSIFDLLTWLTEQSPNLILLGSRFPMSQLGAHVILAALKADPQLRHIPVIVFCGPNCPGPAIHEFYEAQAAAVICFPQTLTEVRTMLGTVKEFWLNIAQLPRETILFYQ